MKTRDLLLLLSRYIVLVVISFPDLRLINYLASPLTTIPVFWILSLFDPMSAVLSGTDILFKTHTISLVSACTGVSAYFLLIILNLSTPMHPSKRIKSLTFLIFSFLALNIARIVIFSLLLANGFQYFDVAHQVVWYFGSTIMVILLWFGNVWLFNIRAIPIYTDIKSIFDSILPSKEQEHEQSKKILKRKVNKILNTIESREKRDYKNAKKEFYSSRT
jgi:exosortase/archaeosortase family protein